MDPHLIHGYRKQHKISRIPIESVQTLLWETFLHLRLISMQQMRRSRCKKVSQPYFFVKDLLHHFYRYPTASVTLLTFTRLSSNTASYTFWVVSGVVVSFDHPSHGSSSRDVLPRLNCIAQLLLVDIGGPVYFFQLRMNFFRGKLIQKEEFYDCTTFKFIHFIEKQSRSLCKICVNKLIERTSWNLSQ